MESIMFLTRIQRLYGLQSVEVTFNKGPESISSLSRLRNLGAKVSDHAVMTLLAIIDSKDWGDDRNRTVTIWNLGLLDEQTLVHVARDVESIKAGDHWASGLMTGRKKRQEEVTAQLIADVLNEEIISEVSSWGASIEGHFLECQGLPAIEFAIRNQESGTTIVLIAVDGWSGRFAIDGEWGDRRFTDAQGVRKRICSALMDAMDRETATA